MTTYADTIQGAKEFINDCMDFGEMDTEEATRLLNEGVFESLGDHVWEVRIDGEYAATLYLCHQTFEIADWLLEEDIL